MDDRQRNGHVLVLIGTICICGQLLFISDVKDPCRRRLTSVHVPDQLGLKSDRFVHDEFNPVQTWEFQREW